MFVECQKVHNDAQTQPCSCPQNMEVMFLSRIMAHDNIMDHNCLIGFGYEAFLMQYLAITTSNYSYFASGEEKESFTCWNV